MNIIVMEKIGFCYGVDRSISITKQVKSMYPQPWILLGPLVHNDIVNQELINDGYQMLKNKDEIIKPAVNTSTSIMDIYFFTIFTTFNLRF